MYGLLAIALSILVSACAVGPDFSRPDVPVTDSFRMMKEDDHLPSIANLPWWDLLKDPVLQQLIHVLQD